jgi:N-acetylneuraminic acid mutarotase
VRTWERILITCAAVVGAAAVLSFVLLVAAPVPSLAGPQDTEQGAAEDVGSACGVGTLISDTWAICAALPTTRTGAAGAVVDGTIYVMGGGDFLSTTPMVDAYDTTGDSWASVADMPTARTGLAASSLDGLVYAVGGWTQMFISPTAVVEVYDPDSDSWSAAASLPAPRGDLAAATVGGRIYAIGGASGFGGVTSTVTAYDPVSDTWELRAPLPTPRSGLAAVVVDGLIYAIGGSDGQSPLAVVEAYDPIADTWSALADMPTARTGLAAGEAGGRIYAVGGSESGFSPTSSLATNQEYDPAADAWRTVAQMPTARSTLVAVGVGGRIYAIGGSVELMSGTRANEVYLPGVPYRMYVPLTLATFAP